MAHRRCISTCKPVQKPRNRRIFDGFVDELVKILSVFLASALAFGKAGMPTAIALFHFDFPKIMAITIPGGITGNIIFTYMSAAIFRALHKYRAKRHLIHRKRIFTPLTRRIIRIKQRFGLTGIAFITPMFLSTPLGAFIAGRFFRNRRRIIIYFSISVVFWALALYFLILFFYDQLRGWLF
jgi:hypothetical protein